MQHNDNAYIKHATRSGSCEIQKIATYYAALGTGQ